MPFDKVAGFKDDSGKFRHARSCNAKFGTHQKDKILERFPGWSVVEALPKYFYVKPLRQRQQSILRKLGWTTLPYPKPHFAAGPLDERETFASEAGVTPAGRSTPPDPKQEAMAL